MRLFGILVLVFALSLTIATEPALATDYSFAVSEGDWDVTTNWSPNGRPQAGDTATIGTTKLCHIVQAEAVETIYVLALAQVGQLNIEIDGSLDLGAAGSTSEVTGRLTFGTGSGSTVPKLIIKNDLTIQGSGTIEGFDGAGSQITYVSTNKRLTINGTVTLTGDLAIYCQFTNSATVSAGVDDTLSLEDGSDPAGDGPWNVTSSSGQLWFKDSAQSLTGHFILQGPLVVDQNVTTTGQLYLKQNGSVTAADDKRFKASGSGL